MMAGFTVLGTLFTIGSIGKARPVITPAAAVITLVLNSAWFAALIIAAQRLST
jgi:hypothetical protein